MSAQKRGSRSREEPGADRLRGITARDALSIGLVSALAGDRPLTETEESFLSNLMDNRGEQFFPDLLYAITHQYFPPLAAEKLWNEILRHKYEMSKALNRNAQIVVATLDYLANFKSDIHLRTLVNEAHIAEIVNLSMRDEADGALQSYKLLRDDRSGVEALCTVRDGRVFDHRRY